MTDATTSLDRILAFYEQYDEAGRLAAGTSQLERARTQEIVKRYLPLAPALVLDVGGGPGVYAAWLAGLGYEVHLLDPLPSHVERSRLLSAKQPETPIASCTVGDARRLDFRDGCADAVLLLGPLYHLIERRDRIVALREAHRTLRAGGWLFAGAISRFASALDGFVRGLFDDPQFGQIVERDLREGQHRNPTDHPAYFTDAYFHRCEDLEAELFEAGFAHEATLAVEGPAWLLQDFETRWQDATRREQLLDVLRQLEAERSLLGASAHFMSIARKKT